jgi:hypothetical protein
MDTLLRINPQKNMYRWYSVGVQNALVDGIAVLVGWGSLKSSFQQWRSYKLRTLEEADTLKDKIIENRLKNGYC